MDESVKRRVWVQCAGRCVICNELLLEDHLDDGRAIRAIGEVAHIAAESDGGPRADTKLTTAERNDPSNLILLCPNDHTSADKRLTDAQYTADTLHAMKRAHEAFVRHATGLRDDARTTVVRIDGEVRGKPGTISKTLAANATMTCARRVPQYLADPAGFGETVSLAGIPDPCSDFYWGAAARKIHTELERIRLAIERGEIKHVSVFAFAYLPLLVHVGTCLDNTYAVDVYQRQDRTSSWIWDDTASPVAFHHRMPRADDVAGDEAVLVTNASGTVGQHLLPDQVSRLPRFVIEPAGDVIAGPETFAHHETLDSFVSSLKTLLKDLEVMPYRQIRKIHVFAAAPLSAAVELGRRWPVGNAAPSMVVYHLDGDTYRPALELPWSPPARSAHTTGGTR